jgi:tRNA (cmo5U34)-methyltransferase
MTNHFDKVARDWDKNLIHVKRTEAIAKILLDVIEINNKMKALEYGAGTGLLSFALKDHFAEITLMDSSAEMINTTAEKIKASGATHLYPLLFDLEKEDYNLKTFDIIFSQMVMHHVADIEKMITKFAMLLNSKGKLVIADLYKEDGSFHEMEFHGHLGFDPEQLGETLKKNGFTNINHQQCFVIERLLEDEKIKKYPVFLMTAEKSV